MLTWRHTRGLYDFACCSIIVRLPDLQLNALANDCYDMSAESHLLLAASLQWEKIRKSGKLPHLTRWYEFLSQTSPLKELLEAHGPKKSAAAERVKEATANKGSSKTAAGMTLEC